MSVAPLRLSVVIVTHDSCAALSAALPALCAQLGGDDELVVVDNASVDGTLAAIGQIAPGAVIVRNAGNAGFAAAANVGARAASSDWLVFLNPDATPAPGFVDAIPGPARHSERVAGACPRREWARRQHERRRGAPHRHRLGRAGGGRRPGRGRVPVRRLPCDSARGVGAARRVRRSLLHVPRGRRPVATAAAGRWAARRRARRGRDDDYEFRKELARWRRLEANRWATIIRGYPGLLLLLLAPALAAKEAALVVVAGASGWLPQKLLATGDILRTLPRLLRERRAVQTTRTIGAAASASRLTLDLDSPYLGRAGRSGPLRWALRAYWRVVLAALRADRVQPRE